MNASHQSDVYVSTTCFEARDLAAILNQCQRDGIGALELSAVDGYDRSLLGATRPPTRYLVHNYFPPPDPPFVLNLCSQDASILQRSRDHCRAAIDLSSELGGAVYAAHGGFTADIDSALLGHPAAQAALPDSCFAPYERAYFTLVESAAQLSRYAAQRGVRFLVENHVLPGSAGEAGRKLLPMVSSDELTRLVRDVGEPGFGLLLDVGHLKVSAATLGFDPHRFVDDVGPAIAAMHLSDNDGMVDAHRPFGDEAWFLPRLKEFPDIPVTVELGSTSPERLKTVCDTVSRWR